MISGSWQAYFEPASPDWPQAQISDVAAIVGGSTPKTTEPEYWDGQIAWATPKDLSRLPSTPLLHTDRRITEEGLRQISSGLLPAGTVLLSSRAPIGYIAIAELPVAINQGFIALRPLSYLTNLYLWQWLTRRTSEIKERANGTTFLEVSKANFRSIGLALPPESLVRAWSKSSLTAYDLVVAAELETERLIALRDALLPKLLSGELRVRTGEKLVEDAV